MSSCCRLAFTHDCSCLGYECKKVQVDPFFDYINRFNPMIDESEELALGGGSPAKSKTQETINYIKETMMGHTTKLALLAVPVLFLLSAYLVNICGDSGVVGMVMFKVDLWKYPLGKVNDSWITAHDGVQVYTDMITGTTDFFRYLYVDMWGDLADVTKAFSFDNLASFWNVDLDNFDKFLDGTIFMRTIIGISMGVLSTFAGSGGGISTSV